MARTKREKSSMGVYHVLFRAADKLFLSDGDYIRFKELLSSYFSDGTQKLLAYSLAENKIHLLIYEGDNEVSKLLKPLGTSYARYINRTYGRSGKLFHDRYKSEAVNDADYMLSCILYIHSQIGIISADEYENEALLCGTDFTFETVGGRDKYIKAVNAGLRVMCMDDYENMSVEEIDRYVQLLSGKYINEIKLMEKKERTDILKSLTQTRWVSARRLGALLDAGRVAAPKTKAKKAPVRKPDPAPAADTGLSVWLL
jgi:REP element-mobilizing transposase RayT